MYKIDDLVVYGKNGICRIKDISKISMSNSDRLYYKLVPVYSREEIIYAPVDNSKIVMRHVISKSKAREFIKEIPELDDELEMDERERERRYKETLSKCDLRQLVIMLRSIYHRKYDRIKLGKKITVADEKYLKLAEEQLYGELAYALELDKKEVIGIMTDIWK